MIVFFERESWNKIYDNEKRIDELEERINWLEKGLSELYHRDYFNSPPKYHFPVRQGNVPIPGMENLYQ